MSNSTVILLVVDDDSLRDTIAEELEKFTTMKILKAKDGVQAYQKTRNQDFAAIVSEYNVKKLNGAQLLISARETESNNNTPFIFYTTALAQAKTETRGYKGVAFFEKPAELKLIAEKIQSMCRVDITRKSFSLDVDFINPFIDSAIKTLNEVCGLDSMEASSPELYADQDLDIDISGTLKLTSPYFKGSIAISFSQNVYQKIIDKMFAKNKSDIKIDTDDGVAEILNIIFGQTKAVLNNRGYSIERAVPNVKKGHNHTIIPKNTIPILLVPFISSLGNFWIQICVKAI